MKHPCMAMCEGTNRTVIITGICTSFHPSLHLHLIIHPDFPILCLIDVKRIISLIFPVAFITRSSIESVTYLYEPCTVRYELFIPVVVDERWWSILGYLFYVCPIRVTCVIFAIHLITRYMCKFDMIVYCLIIEYVIHPLVFILLWLLFYVC